MKNDKISNIIYNNPSREHLIKMLHEIQEIEGYISDNSIEQIANKLNINKTEVYSVITFYTHFRLSPQAKYTLEVCDGTACHVKNSEKIIEILEKQLKIKRGEITKDKIFGIKTVRCIGACAIAPAMKIKNDIYGSLNEEKIVEILHKYRAKEHLENE